MFDSLLLFAWDFQMMQRHMKRSGASRAAPALKKKTSAAGHQQTEDDQLRFYGANPRPLHPFAARARRDSMSHLLLRERERTRVLLGNNVHSGGPWAQTGDRLAVCTRAMPGAANVEADVTFHAQTPPHKSISKRQRRTNSFKKILPFSQRVFL
jgi:hypothetical protein